MTMSIGTWSNDVPTQEMRMEHHMANQANLVFTQHGQSQVNNYILFKNKQVFRNYSLELRNIPMEHVNVSVVHVYYIYMFHWNYFEVDLKTKLKHSNTSKRAGTPDVMWWPL